MGKRTNRVEVLQWSDVVGLTDFDIVAYKIQIVGGAASVITIDGVRKFDLGTQTVTLGPAIGDDGTPINTRFSGVFETQGPVMVFVEYRDPDIGSIR